MVNAVFDTANLDFIRVGFILNDSRIYDLHSALVI